MKVTTKVVLSVAAFLFACESLSARALYVAPSGDGTTMSDWATAAPTIQAAFAAAATDDSVDAIYVKTGKYAVSEQLDWPKANLALRGGYAGDAEGGLPGSRDIERTASTICPADGYKGRLLLIAEKDNATVDGFEITGAYMDGDSGRAATGLGVYATNSLNTLISNCEIHGHKFYSNAKMVSGDTVVYGVAVNISYGTAVVTKCRIHGNSADKDAKVMSYNTIYGVGICVEQGAQAIITDSQIYENTVVNSHYVSYGAGLCTGDTGTSCAVTNCLFYKNQLLKANASSADALHAGKIRQWGGGGRLQVAFCTFAYNGARGLYVEKGGAGSAEVSDSVFYGHTAAAVSGTQAPVLRDVMAEDGTGTIRDDAKLVRNYYLDSASTAINASSIMKAGDLAFAGKYAAIGRDPDTGFADLGYHHPAAQLEATATYYVDPEKGNDGNGGESDQDAFKTLTKAISMGVDTATVRILRGTCSVKSGELFPITINGASSYTIAGPDNGMVTFDADGANSRVMYVVSGSGLKLRNICFCNGRMTGTSGALAHGGGLRIENSSAIELSNCIVSNNVARYEGNNSVGGGGIALLSSSAKLLNCQIVRNSAYVGYMANCRPLGCGIYLQDSASAEMTDCVIARNTYEAPNNQYAYFEAYGTAIYMKNNCTGVLRNCLVYGHFGRQSAIDECSGLKVYSSTIADNACAALQTGAVEIRDSIIAGNYKPFYNDVSTGVDKCYVGDDPGFVDGYHLLADSPAKGLGYTYPIETAVAPREVWVAASGAGDDTNAGTEAAPYRTITKALSGVNDCLTVHVGAGVYNSEAGEVFPLQLLEAGGVKLVGEGAAKTVIDATGASASAMRVVCSSRIAIEGITIRGAKVSPATNVQPWQRTGAAGLDFMATSVASVKSCVITNNWIESRPGGGLAVRNTFLTLTDSRIVGNTSGNATGDRGAGICVAGRPSSLLMDRCELSDNKGGGLYFYSGSDNATVEFRNSLIVRNCRTNDKITEDGGVMLEGGNSPAGTFIADGCTFFGNRNYSIYKSGGVATVRNSILWDGYLGEIYGTVTLDHVCVKGAEADPSLGVISDDPGFKNASKDDYSLTWASPCRNVGVNSPWMTGAVDFKNEPRIKRRIVDMGCYEYQFGGLMLMVR